MTASSQSRLPARVLRSSSQPRARGVGKGKPISLALQGGGAHGAFTWGVLDRLLEENRFSIRAMTGASAGAMNAVALAAGAVRDGPAGARAELEAFWRAVSKAGTLYGAASLAPLSQWMDSLGLPTAPGRALADAMVRMTSPYDRNPLNFHPLRDILHQHIDFDELKALTPAALFIAAANVHSGRARVFETQELSTDVLLASACLPFLFQAVEVEGDHYWDGGYVANPALFPLMDGRHARDLVIVHLNPLRRQDLPTSPDGIINRLNEITFNAAFLAELRALALLERAVSENWLTAVFRRRLRALRVHAVRADEPLADLPHGSKTDTDWGLLTDLRDRGRAAAAQWLSDSAALVGRRSSVDLHDVFLDPSGPRNGW